MVKYDKLVRDKVLVDLKNRGIKFKAHIVKGDVEYWAYLKEKLLEEVNEFLASETEEEMADTLDAIKAIMNFKGRIWARSVANSRSNKTKEKGGYTRRIILDEAEKRS